MRRIRLVVVSLAVASATAVGSHWAGAETVRTGLARAQVARIVPYVGLPGIGAGAGIAQAEIEGNAARATAGVADFGAFAMILGQVGGAAPVPVPDLPTTISADSKGERDVTRNPLPPADLPASPANPALAQEEAHAGDGPTSRAAARGPELGVPGLLTFTGGESRADASRDGTLSTATLGRLALGPQSSAKLPASPLGLGSPAREIAAAASEPLVVLENLVWTARHDMGKDAVATFSVGGIRVAGQALPLAAPGDLAGALVTVNQALEPVGLRLEAPVALADAAGGNVSSLVVAVRNPEAVAAVTGELAKPAAPVLGQVLDTLLAAAPEEAAASRLVVNALLASASGRAGGRLELGGASARVGTMEINAPFLPESPPFVSDPLPAFSAPAAAPAVPEVPFAAPDNFVAGPSYSPTPAAPPGAARTPTTVSAAPGGRQLAALPARVAEQPGGASAPLVLGAALAAVAILALSDKLRLRRAGGIA